MSRRTLQLHWILAGILVIALAGCGGDNGAFESCGNGVLDSGEQCDDGNLVDEDGCLSTCELNVCGDGFVNPAVEDCDLVPHKTCASLGFEQGTVVCSASCKLDSSGCSGVAAATPTPAATPSGGGELPTPTGEAPGSPTVTPTPGSGPTCQSGETTVVAVSLDKAYAGFVVTLAYTGAVNLPGSGTSISDRVVFNVSGGFTSASDSDAIGDDGSDDTLLASFAGNDDQSPGVVFTVTFDCVADQPRPGPSDFTCVPSASTHDGLAIPDVTCSLTVQ